MNNTGLSVKIARRKTNKRAMKKLLSKLENLPKDFPKFVDSHSRNDLLSNAPVMENKAMETCKPRMGFVISEPWSMYSEEEIEIEKSIRLLLR
jgi:hypothetical protein